MNSILRNILPTLFLTSLLLFLTACGKRENLKPWVNINEERLGFSASFPREFKESEIKTVAQETEYGMIINHIYGQSGVAFYYAVSCAKFPGKAVTHLSPSKSLKNAINEVVESYQANVTEEYELMRNGYPGRYLSAEIPKEEHGLINDNKLHTMVFLRGSHLYRVTAVGLGNEPQVKTFFDSFQLKPL